MKRDNHAEPALPGTVLRRRKWVDHSGFRDYLPDLGRYAEPDPLAMQGSAKLYDLSDGRLTSEIQGQSGSSFYSYAHGNSINRVDPYGLWDTYTHHALIWNALRSCGVSNDDIWQIQEESDFIDLVDQLPGDAYKHAMRAPWQSPQSAIHDTNGWIQDNRRNSDVSTVRRHNWDGQSHRHMDHAVWRCRTCDDGCDKPSPQTKRGPAALADLSTQNLRFPGQYFDSESGWNHNGFRDYIPDLGRYAEPDPLAMQGSARHYASQMGRFITEHPLGFQFAVNFFSVNSYSYVSRQKIPSPQ